MNETEESKEEARQDSERELVLPGDFITDGKFRAGSGTYMDDGKIYASTLGIKSIRSDFVNVVPLAGQYSPKVGDQVIGIVMDMGPSNWLVDINSPYPAPMHINEAPWRVDFGDTARYLNVGEVILARIFMVDEVKHVQVSMKEHGLRKLQGGRILDISHTKVPRVIGRNGSMIQMIKNYTNCRVIVGQNGRIWVDGEIDAVENAVKAIRLIEVEAQSIGLTERLKEYLESIQKEKKV
ncbi:MAG TPA: exosome complex RNA-binding protein Rrp4 [Thermoplasmata archaeon]|nr:exosome complex RNA-binding protein Rrp4 [Thermoplasmata archaeon]